MRNPEVEGNRMSLRKPRGHGRLDRVDTDLPTNRIYLFSSAVQFFRVRSGCLHLFSVRVHGGSFRSDTKTAKALTTTPTNGSWDWINSGIASPEIGFRVVRKPE